jgi:fatty-acyl-CoA synthase
MARMTAARRPDEELADWPADRSLHLPTQTIGDKLRYNADHFGHRHAILLPQGDQIRAISHARLFGMATNLARWLAARTVPGDRIGIWSRNAFESILIQHGCALAGLIVCHFNTGWSDTEIGHAIELIKPETVFVGVNTHGDDLTCRLASFASCATIPLSWVQDLAIQPSNYPLPEVRQDDACLIQFTSGTTGKAKAAVLSHRAVLFGGWIRPALQGGGTRDLWLNAVPYHHVGGSVAVIVGSLAMGSTLVVLERYDRDQLVALMALKPSRMGGVPTMWHDILSSPDLPSDRSVDIVTLGGDNVPPALVRQVWDRLGARCTIGYGQSESIAITGTMPDDAIDAMCESVGHPLPHVAIRITDPQTGEILPFGLLGEICVQSPSNMIGYWGNPEATADTIGTDGYLRTGDIGSMDPDGLIRILGRLRELIIRAGENIYPTEVEDALLRHPAVAMAAVVGVDHDRLGQEVGAVIQLRPGATAKPLELEAHVQTLIARFKAPRHWRFVDVIPLTVSGKIRKTELEELFR